MILILDSFFTGSHKYWGLELKRRLPFNVDLLTLSGKHWKWRMEGGAYELAQKFKKLNVKPKIIIATDMVNIPLFYAFSEITTEKIPCIMYFHENQFAYPISNLDTDKVLKRDNHYSFINLTSALFVNQVVFNSEFNKNSFLKGADKLLKKLPKNNIERKISNEQIIFPGVDVPRENLKKLSSTPTILWNHRWEYDKNPDLFIRGLEHLQNISIPFKLIVLGKGTEKKEIKSKIEKQFKKELIHCGYTENKKQYFKLLSEATHLPVTSMHDFFGIGVAEAMSYGCYAVLPNHQAYPEHLINNSESGILYDYPDGFFTALENSIIHSKKGTVKNEFLFENVIKKWTQLISSLC
ncbi:MAG: glycosyl transferase family 1 [Flavobacteriales bacterium]|nr:glycosyl transferase family 1 [Flavobacteriales bacterium]|tara:strand:- start:1921 stop:2976 length:1056 start_codon:yes stop_codon:yes gene_type:complete